jgi:predicted metal-binding protein
MSDQDLEKYCQQAVRGGAAHAKQIHPGTVVTAEWVRWKCQFGCPVYGQGFCCPPDSMPPERTQELLDCYHRAILFHHEAPKSPERKGNWRPYWDMLVNLEGELFKDGYYKAFVLLFGPCLICKKCAKLTGAATCTFGARARPCMEGSGIDVFQTARNNGLFITTLRTKDETINHYQLMPVD